MTGFMFFIPKELATAPAEGHCFVNRWWAVHPDKGVAFYGSRKRPFDMEPGEQDEPSPQCNSCEQTARALAPKLNPECAVEFLPAVFVGPAIKEMLRLRKEASTVARPERSTQEGK